MKRFSVKPREATAESVSKDCWGELELMGANWSRVKYIIPVEVCMCGIHLPVSWFGRQNLL